MDTLNILERVRYWQGQLLASGDLRTQTRSVAELRRLHNRNVHSAFGLAIGLEVGDIAEGTVPVSCGLAYDCAGRELVLPVGRAFPLPTPPISRPTLLTLAYDAASSEAVLAWRTQGKPDTRDSVALARLLPDVAGPTLDPEFHPVITRPLARPRLAFGETIPGDTAWTEWDEGQIQVGVQTTLDTSAAGFTNTPNYFAEVSADTPPDGFVPAWFTSIVNPQPGSFTLRLFMHGITRHTFELSSGRAQVSTTPTPGAPVQLLAGGAFSPWDQVSRLLPMAAKASVVKSISGDTATLDSAIDNFNAQTSLAFGNPPRIATLDGTPNAGDVTIRLHQAKLIQQGDVIARVLPGGAGLGNPVLVSDAPTTKSITLASAIDGLTDGDSLAAADFQIRATVIAVMNAGAQVTVANASVFPPNSTLVHLNDDFAAVEMAAFTSASGNILTLTPAMRMLQPGGILALCSLPVSVTVTGIDPDGTIQVNLPDVIKVGSFVASLPAHPGISTVTESNGLTLRLSLPIPGLAINDALAVITMSGVVDASPGASATKVKLNASNRIRPGDFLAPISGWREPSFTRSLATVLQTNNTALTLSPALDGLMKGDTIGFASIASTAYIVLRLKDLPVLTPGDEVLLVAPDLLTGQTVAVFAKLIFIFTAQKLVYLMLSTPGGSFTIRPEDLTASVLFLRGSPLALVQNLNLYVSWLACQNPDPMPRPCTDDPFSHDPCGTNA